MTPTLRQAIVDGAYWLREPGPNCQVVVALLGDAELDEGNIFEALLEGWKQGVRNCWWIVDYNRQSLDAVVREGLWERYENLFRNFGWDVVVLKYGSITTGRSASSPTRSRAPACLSPATRTTIPA